MRDAGELNEIQKQWFRESKPEEELFDTESDPHEINNIAHDPNYQDKLVELRKECESWMQLIDDKGFIPEKELIEQFYPNGKRQITKVPEVRISDNLLSISCSTKGASLGYRYGSEKKPYLGWEIYKNPIEIKDNDTLEIISHRIGFMPSITKFYNQQLIN